ncbi:MAG TPA: FCSD flavin-binding domain-containing protein, partial [Paracoccaceae bacterium]|nr:FCSD flavin-binding domain-containing protein [Paracoccaceae bacterium]
HDRVDSIDADRRSLRLAGGADLSWDRLIVSPGIDIRWDAIEGYGPEAAEVMPHAWKAGAQTALLRDQLQAMDDGGVVLMTIPQNPYRCPPGPYERASLIAHYLKTRKPRSKLILLDAKDRFSKQALFQEAWAALYPDHLEWVPFAQNGNLLRVDPATRTVQTEFGRMQGDVVNVIPPQRAGALAVTSGLTGGQDWCEVDQASFAARALPGVHVLGDAAIAGAMPKSAFSATAQAKLCAAAIVADLSGTAVPEALLVNTCYSLVAPDWGISVADVFRIGADGTLVAVEGAGGISPLAQDAGFRQREAGYARSWFANMTADTWG